MKEDLTTAPSLTKYQNILSLLNMEEEIVSNRWYDLADVSYLWRGGPGRWR